MTVAPSELMGHTPTDVAELVERYSEPAPNDAAANSNDHAVSGAGRNRLLDLSQLGDDAGNVDLVVLGTDTPWTVDPERFHSKARNTPFGGWQVTGRPLATIIAGKLVFTRLQ